MLLTLFILRLQNRDILKILKFMLFQNKSFILQNNLEDTLRINLRRTKKIIVFFYIQAFEKYSTYFFNIYSKIYTLKYNITKSNFPCAERTEFLQIFYHICIIEFSRKEQRKYTQYLYCLLQFSVECIILLLCKLKNFIF